MTALPPYLRVYAVLSTGWGSRIVSIILSDVPDGAITANSDSVGATLMQDTKGQKSR